MKTLVIPVNCQGVMGGGLALQFKRKYPQVYPHYVKDCRHGQLKPGSPTYYLSPKTQYPYWFVFFPTKDRWKEPSKLSFIDSGMHTLTKINAALADMDGQGFKSIAFPMLGCGLGGLEWNDVEPIMKSYLEHWEIPVELHTRV